jgi:hypothetical protein
MAKLKSQHPVDLILESSSALFICGAVFAIISMVLQGIHSPKALIVATSLPAAASLLLLVAALMVPGLYAVGKMAFPLNFTLPLIHGSLVYMLAELTRGSFGLEKPPVDLQPALWWDNLSFLGLAVLFQVVLLTALVGLRPNLSPGGPAPDVQR